MAGQSSFKWHQAQVKAVENWFMGGLIHMGFAIADKARANSPVDIGALKNSIRTTVDGNNKVYVIAGGTVGKDEQGVARVINGRFKIPYAKKREYENNKHPNTKFYLHRAFETVTNGDVKRYWEPLK